MLSVGTAAHPAGGVRVKDIQTALTWLDANLHPDDTVLVKASRAAQLDLIANALKPTIHVDKA